MSDPKLFLTQAKSLESELIELRRHFHAHPELSFHEFETAKVVADRLSLNGYEVKRGVGKTGVIADIGTGPNAGASAGPRIAIRADMDGLPIQEENKTGYQSKNDIAMHACGHDAHMACALTASKILAGHKNDLGGGIRMVMQPAEEYADDEGFSGAYRMIEDDALNGVSAIIGLHLDASLPAGKIGILPGPTMAAVDTFKVIVKGKGGHGAYPETAIDAVVLGAHVVQAIQQVISRRISALEPAIITIGSFQSSSIRSNIISEEVTLLGSFRSFTPEVRQQLFDEIERACSVARALGGDYVLTYEFGYPATVNDPIVTEVMRQAAEDLIGKENIVAIKPRTWSEDFSMFANIIPGAFMFLGGEIAGDQRTHHSATFDIDESGLYRGSAILAETAKRLITHYKR